MKVSSAGTATQAPAEFIQRVTPWVVTITSIVAFAAAAVLMVEKIILLGDPTYVPTCSINPVLSCGSIMKSDQAEAFGFPNPLLGLAGFGLMTT
ncbi:MAG TPA: vitamin K epoxide reductase family protein, partial [Solirubrobacterales bacterium]|nr:vitamin K epoxide reductase family protein [Solirubrobacterales bacterium]